MISESFHLFESPGMKFKCNGGNGRRIGMRMKSRHLNWNEMRMKCPGYPCEPTRP